MLGTWIDARSTVALTERPRDTSLCNHQDLAIFTAQSESIHNGKTATTITQQCGMTAALLRNANSASGLRVGLNVPARIAGLGC